MKHIIISLLLLYSLGSFGQKKTVAITNEKMLGISQEKFDLIIENPKKYNVFSADMKHILEINPDLKGWVSYYALMAQLQYRDKKPDSTLYFANKAIEQFENSDKKRDVDEKQLMRAYYFKGKVLGDEKEYFKATQEYLTSIALGKKYEYKWLGFYRASLASNHLSVGDLDKALSTYYELVKDENYVSLEGANVYDQIGQVHFYRNHKDSAQHYYNKALQQSNIDKSKRATVYHNLGYLHYKLGETNASLSYFRKADSIVVADTLDVPFGNSIKGFLLLSDARPNEAITLLSTVLKDSVNYEAMNRNAKDLLVFTYDNLIASNEKLGNITGVVNVSKEKSLFLERYNSIIFDEKITDLTARYEVKEKDASIKSLEERNESQNTILKQRSIITWGIVGLFLLVGILTYLFYRKRRTDQKLKLASVEQRLLRSQLNPHFLFNALNSVVGLASQNSEKTVPYTIKLSSLLRSILQNSREEFVTVSEEIKSIKDYLELESNFSERFTYSINIAPEIDTEEVLIPPMFIQPFVENAIQHGFLGKDNEKIELSVALDESKKSMHCTISDNGLGYSKVLRMKEENKGYKSLSGKILQERLALYAKAFKTKAYYRITDLENEGGTCVDVYLPYLLDS